MRTIFPLTLAGLLCSLLLAAEKDEFKVKRQEVFEFAGKPRLTREGDHVTIAFEAKGYCDATVAIENAEGKIVRHLASGVLGSKAPEPFQKDALKQTLVWDGKDDQGTYLDDKESLAVRVSLGLKPAFERTLFWSPHKRIGVNSPLLAAAPEGMYVYEGSGLDSLRLFDHDGNYARTIYPFPAEKLQAVQGLNLQEFPQDGQRLPVKLGPKHRSSLLTAGCTVSERAGHGKGGQAASAFAAMAGRLALAAGKLNRLTPDGSSGAWALEGSDTCVLLDRPGVPYPVSPKSAAFSPDGRWLYLTFYYFNFGYPEPSDLVHAVMRVDFAGQGKAELFAGSLKYRDGGSGEKQLRSPTAVACDAQGRVYVADYMNDRIQVFDEQSKLLKSIPAQKPVWLAVHQKSGEIYVGSWFLPHREFAKDIQVTPTLTHLGPWENPKVLATAALPFLDHCSFTFMNRTSNLQFQLALDSWSEPPALWVLPGLPHEFGNAGIVLERRDNKSSGVRILIEKDGKLVEKRDFTADVLKAVARVKPANQGGGAGPRQRLYVNPKNGRLYVGEADCGDSKAFNQLVEIDPETGKGALVNLPMASEDLAIDLNGLFLLRSDVEVARFDPASLPWREIPWDYGEEREGAGFGSNGARMCKLISGLVLPAVGRPAWWHMGGMAVSPKGHLAITCYNDSRPLDRRETEKAAYGGYNPAGRKGGKYVPKLYPGRATGWETHVWDRHGKLVCEDATPGFQVTDGIGLDKDDNLFVMVCGNRVLDGKPYFLPWTETYAKVKAGQVRAISPDPKCQVPAAGNALPKRAPDLDGLWIEGAEWFYGGVGFQGWASGSSCICWNTRPALDLFARSFLAEVDHFSVAVLDANGNLILRIGKYGNVEDGKPLVPDGGPAQLHSIGGDEVALFHAAYLGTHTDRRLFIADAGNSRILSVKLDYQANEKIFLKDVRDEGAKSGH